MESMIFPVSPYATACLNEPMQNVVDLQLAEALSNLFINIVILGYFFTIRKNKAVIINNYWYRFQKALNDGSEKWVFMTDGCSSNISLNNGILVKLNWKYVDKDSDIDMKLHKFDKCMHSFIDSKKKLFEDELSTVV